MDLRMKDIDTGNGLAEAEERNAPVAKLVKASDFHSDNRGFESHQEYQNMNTSWEIGFNNCIGKTAIVDGRLHTRLGFS